MNYNQTGTFLDRILEHKVVELAEHQKYIALSEMTAFVADIQHEDPPRDFVGALHKDTVALIAEVKKASPSKGVLIENFDPVALGKTYADNGAAAISVLTDKQFFQGDLKHLYDVRQTVNIPVLRKDFVIDPYQVYGGRASGADAILLIVAILSDHQLSDLQTLTHSLGMTALVEVHDEIEVERALKAGASVIGINNRDLKTFEVDLGLTARLVPHIPKDVTIVGESGIQTTADVRHMAALGVHAVLVGEALVKSSKLATAVQAFSTVKR